jgi:hypothetical protein
MSVISVEKDLEGLSVLLVAEFDAPIERFGSCGPTRGSWSAGGGRGPTPRPSRSTSWPLAVR